MQRSGFFVTSLLFAALALPGAAQAQGSSIIQQGRGNAAGIVQAGTANEAGLRQFGAYNTGTIAQAGNDNSACLVQTGRHLDGAVVQTGDNLSIGVLQTRFGVSEIPVESCTAMTSRRDVMIYMAGANRAAGRGYRR